MEKVYLVVDFCTLEVNEGDRTCSSLTGQMEKKEKDYVDAKIERTEKNRKTENILKKENKKLKQEIPLKEWNKDFPESRKVQIHIFD